LTQLGIETFRTFVWEVMVENDLAEAAPGADDR